MGGKDLYEGWSGLRPGVRGDIFSTDEYCSGKYPREAVTPGRDSHDDIYKIRKKWKPETGWQMPQLLSWAARDSSTHKQRAGHSSHQGKIRTGPSLYRTREIIQEAWETLTWLAGGLPEGKHLMHQIIWLEFVPLHPPWRHFHLCLKK